MGGQANYIMTSQGKKNEAEGSTMMDCEPTRRRLVPRCSQLESILTGRRSKARLSSAERRGGYYSTHRIMDCEIGLQQFFSLFFPENVFRNHKWQHAACRRGVFFYPSMPDRFPFPNSLVGHRARMVFILRRGNAQAVICYH